MKYSVENHYSTVLMKENDTPHKKQKAYFTRKVKFTITGNMDLTPVEIKSWGGKSMWCNKAELDLLKSKLDNGLDSLDGILNIKYISGLVDPLKEDTYFKTKTNVDAYEVYIEYIPSWLL